MRYGLRFKTRVGISVHEQLSDVFSRFDEVCKIGYNHKN